MVGEVMQGPGRAAGRLHVAGILHGADDRGDHLRGAHEGVARGLLFGQLMHHHGCLVHNNLGRGQGFK